MVLYLVVAGQLNEGGLEAYAKLLPEWQAMGKQDAGLLTYVHLVDADGAIRATCIFKDVAAVDTHVSMITEKMMTELGACCAVTGSEMTCSSADWAAVKQEIKDGWKIKHFDMFDNGVHAGA